MKRKAMLMIPQQAASMAIDLCLRIADALNGDKTATYAVIQPDDVRKVLEIARIIDDFNK